MLDHYKSIYLCAKKFAKRNLVLALVHFVRRGRGRFLQKNSRNGMYYEVGDDRACAKVAQTIREGSSSRLAFASNDDKGALPKTKRAVAANLEDAVAPSTTACTRTLQGCQSRESEISQSLSFPKQRQKPSIEMGGRNEDSDDDDSSTSRSCWI